jgi:hypothetical protein
MSCERGGGESNPGGCSQAGQRVFLLLDKSISGYVSGLPEEVLAKPRVSAGQAAHISRAVVPPIVGGLYCGYALHVTPDMVLWSRPADRRRALLRRP